MMLLIQRAACLAEWISFELSQNCHMLLQTGRLQRKPPATFFAAAPGDACWARVEQRMTLFRLLRAAAN
ncbi:hypothetical protein [Bradyrhizobium sp. ORS 375]|uniref:hypothetical protein n=1 Tax=Bradyrhizobium sp. (strain ORS 375) TaxID=566679 RepID=UPI001112BCA6|nr:hypothetical protein [Bradyrhizobium sp. ORS 375]